MNVEESYCDLNQEEKHDDLNDIIFQQKLEEGEVIEEILNQQNVENNNEGYINNQNFEENQPAMRAENSGKQHDENKQHRNLYSPASVLSETGQPKYEDISDDESGQPNYEAISDVEESTPKSESGQPKYEAISDVEESISSEEESTPNAEESTPNAEESTPNAEAEKPAYEDISDAEGDASSEENEDTKRERDNYSPISTASNEVSEAPKKKKSAEFYLDQCSKCDGVIIHKVHKKDADEQVMNNDERNVFSYLRDMYDILNKIKLETKPSSASDKPNPTNANELENVPSSSSKPDPPQKQGIQIGHIEALFNYESVVKFEHNLAERYKDVIAEPKLHFLPDHNYKKTKRKAPSSELQHDTSLSSHKNCEEKTDMAAQSGKKNKSFCECPAAVNESEDNCVLQQQEDKTSCPTEKDVEVADNNIDVTEISSTFFMVACLTEKHIEIADNFMGVAGIPSTGSMLATPNKQYVDEVNEDNIGVIQEYSTSSVDTYYCSESSSKKVVDDTDICEEKTTDMPQIPVAGNDEVQELNHYGHVSAVNEVLAGNTSVLQENSVDSSVYEESDDKIKGDMDVLQEHEHHGDVNEMLGDDDMDGLQENCVVASHHSDHNSNDGADDMEICEEEHAGRSQASVYEESDDKIKDDMDILQEHEHHGDVNDMLGDDDMDGLQENCVVASHHSDHNSNDGADDMEICEEEHAVRSIASHCSDSSWEDIVDDTGICEGENAERIVVSHCSDSSSEDVDDTGICEGENAERIVISHCPDSRNDDIIDDTGICGDENAERFGSSSFQESFVEVPHSNSNVPQGYPLESVLNSPELNRLHKESNSYQHPSTSSGVSNEDVVFLEGATQRCAVTADPSYPEQSNNQIERIIKKKISNKQLFYLIKWMNLPSSSNRWLPLDETVKRFHSHVEAFEKDYLNKNLKINIFSCCNNPQDDEEVVAFANIISRKRGNTNSMQFVKKKCCGKISMQRRT